MKQSIICKGLAVAVIILFLGVGIQPAFATTQPKEIDIEPKDNLFQTIIDIANNPDVMKLLEQYNHNMFTSDYDYKSVYRQLLLKKPRLLFSMLFTKPSITYEYLDKCYNKGIEIINIIGENKVLEILESVGFSNTMFLDKIINIIRNDKNLYLRIATLKQMNQEIQLDSILKYHFVICFFLLIIIFVVALIANVYLIFIYWLMDYGDFPKLFDFVYQRYRFWENMAIMMNGLWFDIGCAPFKV